MKLPALLPRSLEHTAKYTSENELFENLILNLNDFVVFFEYACDDETWSGSHSTFMKLALEWLTTRGFYDKLPIDIIHKTALKIQEHRAALGSVLPKNFIVISNGIEHEASSLLWIASSEILHDQIRQECRDKHSRKFHFEGYSSFVFDQIQEYIDTGQISHLWSKTQYEILDILEAAESLKMKPLGEICEDLLKKYISFENVIETLIEAYHKKRFLLAKKCVDLINAQDLGLRFEKEFSEYFTGEFVNFKEEALKIFEKARSVITRLKRASNLTDPPLFSVVIKDCPSLICLDISATIAFTDRLVDLPKNLQELDIAFCEWVEPLTLKKLINICPYLTKIGLAGNEQLNYRGWALLKEWRHLQKLDLSQCRQIKDDDFRLILQGCRGLTHLYLNECSGLSDNSFFGLGKAISKLIVLSIAKTNISDGGLIDLVTNCQELRFLDVSRSPNVTEKGLLEVVRRSPFLELFDVSKCPIRPETIAMIHKWRPKLKLLL